MSEIKVGDTVSWQEAALAQRPYLHTKKGIVTGISEVHGYAEIKPEGIYYAYRVPLDKLTRIGPIGAVVDADEYAQLRAMGDLGGAELG